MRSNILTGVLEDLNYIRSYKGEESLIEDFLFNNYNIMYRDKFKGNITIYRVESLITDDIELEFYYKKIILDLRIDFFNKIFNYKKDINSVFEDFINNISTLRGNIKTLDHILYTTTHGIEESLLYKDYKLNKLITKI